MSGARQTKARIILNVVDNERDFIRVSRVGAKRSHSLLNKKSKRFSWAGENDGLHIGHVETFAEKFGVA